ncbi:MAG: prolipoprotein diacylglyceryl transferase [Candidatus Hydrogenedentes bacterium]|nr:prolipoprotein diacylglyceryl transferase [Candidatus Hydrogenedentota bacterium]
MYPVLFHIGPINIYMYGLMIAIGFLVTVFLIQRDARKIGVDPKLVGEMGFWTLLWGIIGARLAHIIMYPEGYSWTDPIGWINVSRGGLVFQGAIPTALGYVYWGLKKRGMAFWPKADLAVPYVPLAQAFGRVGCFFYGCCYGRRADGLPWAVCFPAGSPAYSDHSHRYPDFASDAAWSFPVHPTQLYSVGLLFLIFGIMLLFRRTRFVFVGHALPLYLMLYGVKRFIVECFRGDGNPTLLGFGLLTNQQVFSLLMLIVGVGLFLYLRARRDVAPAT